MRLKQAVPCLDIIDRFAKGLIIGNGHVNRMNAALRHLVKHFGRPVGVLKAIDQIGCLGHSGVPDKI